MESSDLVNVDLDDDTLSYCCKRSDCSSSRCDSDCDVDVAYHEVNNEC